MPTKCPPGKHNYKVINSEVVAPLDGPREVVNVWQCTKCGDTQAGGETPPKG